MPWPHGGVTRVTDVTGSIDVAGTRYTVWFGPMKSSTEILAVERPHSVHTRFGNLILKGESDVRFELGPLRRCWRDEAGPGGVVVAMSGSSRSARRAHSVIRPRSIHSANTRSGGAEISMLIRCSAIATTIVHRYSEAVRCGL